MHKCSSVSPQVWELTSIQLQSNFSCLAKSYFGATSGFSLGCRGWDCGAVLGCTEMQPKAYTRTRAEFSCKTPPEFICSQDWQAVDKWAS